MVRNLRLAAAAAAAVLVATVPGIASAQSTGSTAPFPRLGAYVIGGPFDYNDPAYEASLAKLSVVILTYYPGLQPGGESMNSVIQAIKAINPSTRVILYAISDSINPSGQAYSSLISKIDAMHWWLYPQGTSGTPVPGDLGQIINNTTFTAKDSSGLNSVDWIANYFVQNLYNPNASADGMYIDNMYWRPRVNGDWSLSGTDTASTSPQAGTWLREGYARYIEDMRKAIPGKLQLGNVADWGEPQAVLTEYQGILDGGVIEGIIGKSYSVEAYGGWQAMLAYYRKVMAALGGPKYGIFGQDGSVTDYQSMRYGLTSCLMDDGYYYFSSDTELYHGVNWFDEFNSNLGQSVSPPPTAAWQKGVYRRDFQNGIALVNPKGNGPQTVTLETAFVKIKGTQAPSINDGSTVTTVTLADRDGIILLRKNPVAKPKPPTNISVQP